MTLNGQLFFYLSIPTLLSKLHSFANWISFHVMFITATVYLIKFIHYCLLSIGFLKLRLRLAGQYREKWIRKRIKGLGYRMAYHLVKGTGWNIASWCIIGEEWILEERMWSSEGREKHGGFFLGIWRLLPSALIRDLLGERSLWCRWWCGAVDFTKMWWGWKKLRIKLQNQKVKNQYKI